jgi:hypothetical protein
MIDQILPSSQGTSSWLLSPGCFVDSLLDRIEELRSIVLPAKADNPPYRAEIEARLEQLGA